MWTRLAFLCESKTLANVVPLSKARPGSRGRTTDTPARCVADYSCSSLSTIDHQPRGDGLRRTANFRRNRLYHLRSEFAGGSFGPEVLAEGQHILFAPKYLLGRRTGGRLRNLRQAVGVG